MAGAGNLSVSREAFCQAYARCGSATQAYKDTISGGKCTDGTAQVQSTRIMKNPNVKSRIAEIRAMTLERENKTIDDMVDQLEADRAFARESNNASAAVKATESIAKLLGFMTEKHDHQHSMNPEAARQLIASLGAKYLAKSVV